MSNISKNDVSELFNLVQEQLSEDRESLNDLYKKLEKHIGDDRTRFIDLGEVIAKIADLKLKQTAQVLDAFKTVEKIVPKEDFDGFTEDDLATISKGVNKVKKNGNK